MIGTASEPPITTLPLPTVRVAAGGARGHLPAAQSAELLSANSAAAVATRLRNSMITIVVLCYSL